ncbi:MAG: threonylcarbamoyl-AMP synthase [Denitrovibrio sp.]|nr:MAG: threonylcarbamoyl-AMP synthase [Denitrovibrio sp.]
MLIAKANLNNAKDIFKRALEKSEPVIFPTDTIYGIGAPIADTSANEKIFEIKGREQNKPFPVLVSCISQLEDIAIVENAEQTRLIEKLWPAPVTLILKAKSWLPELYTLDGTIAVRMPDKKWLCEMIQSTGPISATSANLSGKPYENNFKTITEMFQKHVDFYIYDKHIADSSSALIDISSSKFKILRKSTLITNIDRILD